MGRSLATEVLWVISVTAPGATPAQAWPDFSVAQTHSGPCTDAFRQDPCVRLTWQLFSVFSGNVQETLIHFFLNS